MSDYTFDPLNATLFSTSSAPARPTFNTTWLHCNSCGRVADRGCSATEFYIANCRHTFCKKCIDRMRTGGNAPKCSHCKKEVRFMHINERMNPQCAFMFIDPKTLIRRNLAPTKQAYAFQKAQSNLLLKHQDHLLDRLARKSKFNRQTLEMKERELETLKSRDAKLERKLGKLRGEDSIHGSAQKKQSQSQLLLMSSLPGGCSDTASNAANNTDSLVEMFMNEINAKESDPPKRQEATESYQELRVSGNRGDNGDATATPAPASKEPKSWKRIASQMVVAPVVEVYPKGIGGMF